MSLGALFFLGVDDDGKVLGIENDYKTLGKKPNRDGYENWLTTLLLGEFGKDASPLIRISFHQIDRKDICQLAFKPSPRPVFVKDGNGEHLYIRAGNSTRLLTSREAIEYSKHRWP
jgi:predicted HTH transcriptional regulator